MSSGLPDATFSLIRSASGKSLAFTGPSACAGSGSKSPAVTTIRAAIFMLVPPTSCFETHLSRRPACRPFVDADRDHDDEADHEFLNEGRNAHEDEPVAHHADDEHAENRAQNRSLASRKRCAANNGGGDHVELEAEAGPARLPARQEGEAQNSREPRERAHQDEGPDLHRIDIDARNARRLDAAADRENTKAEIGHRQDEPCGRGDDDEEDELHRHDAEQIALAMNSKALSTPSEAPLRVL